MQIAVFSTRDYDREFLDRANEAAGRPHRLVYHEARLTAESASMAAGADAVCAFVNDRLDRSTLNALAGQGTRLVALRSAGFNHVDLDAARDLGISVARVPAYSPHAVAEHTIALILALNRKIHRAYNRVREGNFALDNLLGFDLSGRTVGVVGTGKIGAIVARILHCFGCTILASDPVRRADIEALGRYVEPEEIFDSSDIITLHCPLTPATHHMIDACAVGRMRRGVMLINTSRGAVVDTKAVIAGLKSGQIGYLGLDVYEEEEGLFFENLSEQLIQDDVFARLLTFPNVLITAHQAFFTAEALGSIGETTIENVTSFEATGRPANEVLVDKSA